MRRQPLSRYALSVLMGLVSGVLILWTTMGGVHAKSPDGVLPAGGLRVVKADAPDSIVQLSPDELNALPHTQVKTSTAVTDGVIAFEGVLIRDLLEALDMSPEHITATALNDYEIDIPSSDFESFDVLLAWIADGRRLERDDKGP